MAMRHIPFRIVAGLFCLLFFILSVPSGAVLAATDSYYTKESFFIAPGGLVVVEAAFQNVEVYHTAEPAVEVEVKMEISSSSKQNVQRLIDAYKPVFTAGENLLEIRATPDKYINFYGMQRCSGSIKLTVPAEIDLEIKTSSGDCLFRNVDVKSITAATSSGDISFRGTVQILTANTASGDISLTGSVENLKVHTASGEIEAEFTTPVAFVEAESVSGDIELKGPVVIGELHSVSGEIEIRGLERGRIKASTVSGALSVHCTSLADETSLSVETVSGNIRFFLPEDVKLTGEIETKSGRIETDLPGRFGKRNKIYFLEDQEAEAEIYASTTSGSIYLLSGKDQPSSAQGTPKDDDEEDEDGEEDETLIGKAKGKAKLKEPASPPVAILNLYCYEKMLTPGLKYRIGSDLYATGNIEYSYREKDLKLQLGAVYLFPGDSRFHSFYWGGGVQFTNKKGFQCPYLMAGTNFFFLFGEVVYPWELETAPQSRFGLKIIF
ncbi:MAG TPA: DUF4097 family beta strand repeat-containing protein [Capillibacterium sp.]